MCRSKGEKRKLARLVCLSDSTLVWDEGWSAPGRGAYVHLNLECLSKMSQLGRWERALRLVSGTLNRVQVNELATIMMRRVSKNVP